MATAPHRPSSRQAPRPQSFPQAPQFAECASDVSHPSLASEEQSAKKSKHVGAHVPATQERARTPSPEQAFPQMPQLSAFVRVSTSQPSAGSPLQSANPGAHAPLLPPMGGAPGSPPVPARPTETSSFDPAAPPTFAAGAVRPLSVGVVVEPPAAARASPGTPVPLRGGGPGLADPPAPPAVEDAISPRAAFFGVVPSSHARPEVHAAPKSLEQPPVPSAEAARAAGMNATNRPGKGPPTNRLEYVMPAVSGGAEASCVLSHSASTKSRSRSRALSQSAEMRSRDSRA
jgi:hypothetical protein